MKNLVLLSMMILLSVPVIAQAVSPIICTEQTLRETVIMKKNKNQDLSNLQKKGWWKKCPLTVRKTIYAEFFAAPVASSSLKKVITASRLPILRKSPELEGLGTWFNSDPLTLASLKGKVVFIDFWTYSCINCIRTLPSIQGYFEKYHKKPFVVIGVHSPEFPFEKSTKNLGDAIKKHGLTYPIVQDNDFATWSVFENRYWPAAYIIDADGNLRYTHFGEGKYEEMDTVIQDLLGEIGA